MCHASAEQPWLHGCPEGGLQGAEAAVCGAGQQGEVRCTWSGAGGRLASRPPAWPPGTGLALQRELGDRPLLGPEHALLPSQPFTRQEIVGFVIGSVSSVLYLFSRLPQIRTNVSPGGVGAGEGSAARQLGPRGCGGARRRRSGPTLTVGLATLIQFSKPRLCLWKRGAMVPAIEGSP